MIRVDIIVAVLSLALLIFCLVDVISIYEWRVRTLNKIAWVFIIILLPIIGPVLWLTLGKLRKGEPDRAIAGRGPIGPDDDPEFFRRNDRIDDQDERIRRLEAELRELRDDDSDDR